MRLDAVTYTNVSTDTTILTTPGYLFGYSIIPLTTGVVAIAIYDASATATGTVVVGDYAASTAGRKTVTFAHPIACRLGIHIDVTCTSAADGIAVFYSKAKV